MAECQGRWRVSVPARIGGHYDDHYKMDPGRGTACQSLLTCFDVEIKDGCLGSFPKHASFTTKKTPVVGSWLVLVFGTGIVHTIQPAGAPL